jgi:superkiller protein 3
VQRAVALEPNSAFGYYALGQALNAVGRPAEALAAVEKARGLNPKSTDFYVQGWAYAQLGHWRESISALKRLSPSNNPWPHVWLAVNYVELGRDDTAKAEIAEVLKLNPQFSVKFGVAGFPVDQEHAAADLRKAGLN